ncbi:hypothetical protein GGR55DRAFT_679371 [Xylaria sp. FL0064]|nr:hypothetical protein GGR55DRAFT_679371 [Xylaria sp. FL0064]
MSSRMGMFAPTDEIKPFTTLGLVVTGEEIYSNDSVYVFYFTPSHWDRPDDVDDHGLDIETFSMSKRPRALFELGPWMQNRSMRNFGDWLQVQFPAMKANMRDSDVRERDPYQFKREFVENVLRLCPWIWIIQDQVDTAWEDAQRITWDHWEEFMRIGRDDPVEPKLLHVFERVRAFRRGIFVE